MDKPSQFIAFEPGSYSIKACYFEVDEEGVKKFKLVSKRTRCFENSFPLDLVKASSEIKDVLSQCHKNWKKLPVYVGISKYSDIGKGSHSLPIEPGSSVSQEIIEELYEQASKLIVHSRSKLIDIMALRFILMTDKETHQCVHNPIGMKGISLRMDYEYVLLDESVYENMLKPFLNAGVEEDKINFLFLPFNTFLSILDENELEAGAIILDLGWSKLDITVGKNRQFVGESRSLSIRSLFDYLAKKMGLPINHVDALFTSLRNPVNISWDEMDKFKKEFEDAFRVWVKNEFIPTIDDVLSGFNDLKIIITGGIANYPEIDRVLQQELNKPYVEVGYVKSPYFPEKFPKRPDFTPIAGICVNIIDKFWKKTERLLLKENKKSLFTYFSEGWKTFKKIWRSKDALFLL